VRQLTLAYHASFEQFGRKGKQELFLDRLEQVVHWPEFLALVAPHYPKAGNGRQPAGLSIMFSIYILQQWFGF
jgi:IS5 family transposase